MVEIRPLKYIVSSFEEGHDGHYLWALWIDYRRDDKYVVIDGFGEVYNAEGEKQYEPRNSEKTDEYREKFYMPFTEAVSLAQRLLPDVVVNGMTAEQLRAKESESTNV